MKNNKRILLINDVTGYGRVSTFAMLPILTTYGHHPYVLPTSLVSNTMDYGSCEILDTTEFMKNAINKWREFGFKFNVISTGFINSSEQSEIITSFIDEQDSPFVLVDPIMAENGELYPGMYPGAIECNRKLLSKSDVCVPNLTEAELIADKYVGETILSDSQYQEIVDALLNFGAKNIVITDCKDSDNNSLNFVYNYSNKKISKIPFERIDCQFIGTGDVFSATLLSELLLDKKIEEAVDNTASFVKQVIIDNLSNEDHFDLIIENSLSNIRNK